MGSSHVVRYFVRASEVGRRVGEQPPDPRHGRRWKPSHVALSWYLLRHPPKLPPMAATSQCSFPNPNVASTTNELPTGHHRHHSSAWPRDTRQPALVHLQYNGHLTPFLQLPNSFSRKFTQRDQFRILQRCGSCGMPGSVKHDQLDTQD